MTKKQKYKYISCPEIKQEYLMNLLENEVKDNKDLTDAEKRKIIINGYPQLEWLIAHFIKGKKAFTQKDEIIKIPYKGVRDDGTAIFPDSLFARLRIEPTKKAILQFLKDSAHVVVKFSAAGFSDKKDEARKHV